MKEGNTIYPLLKSCFTGTGIKEEASWSAIFFSGDRQAETNKESRRNGSKPVMEEYSFCMAGNIGKTKFL